MIFHQVDSIVSFKVFSSLFTFFISLNHFIFSAKLILLFIAKKLIAIVNDIIIFFKIFILKIINRR